MRDSLKSFANTSTRLSKNPLGIIALFIVLVYAVAALVVGLSGSSLESAQRWPLIWFLTLFPVCVLIVFTILVAFFHTNLYAPSDHKDPNAFVALATAQKALQLESPEGDEEITYKHITLLHSSWRYAVKDAEYGRPMWAFHLIVIAKDDVLDRIESVCYTLHPSYPKSSQKQVVTHRKTSFALKELAWDESVVRASIKIRSQQSFVKLNRYINLTETGPRL